MLCELKRSLYSIASIVKDPKLKITPGKSQDSIGIPFGDDEYMLFITEDKKTWNAIGERIIIGAVITNRFLKSQNLLIISALINVSHPLHTWHPLDLAGQAS